MRLAALAGATIATGCGSNPGNGAADLPSKTPSSSAPNPQGPTPTPVRPGATPTFSPSPVPAPTATAPVATARATAPTASDWNALAKGLRGDLLRSGPAYDTDRKLFNPRFDNVKPSAVVRCAEPADVAESIAFARRYGVPIVSRSGGHSYVGASTRAGGMVLDVRPMAGITVGTGTARVGAGALLKSVYSVLGARGRVVPGGTCPTVGIAGLALGGGEGLATRKFGLTCDAIQSLQLVTADGKIRTVDAHHDAELFWACRGGGGGTFGVVTAFQLKTFPSPTFSSFRATWSWSNAGAVLRGWQNRMRAVGDSVWANLHLQTTSGGSRSAVVFGVTFDNDPTDQLAKLVAAVGKDPSGTSIRRNRKLGPLGGSDRVTFFAGSDVLKAPIPAAGIDAVLAVVNRAVAAKLQADAIFDPLGGAAGRVGPDATAFPWRSAFATIQWYAERGRTTTAAAEKWVRESHASVRASSAGAYVNYLEPARPGGSPYFGTHLKRLRAAKVKYDPGNVFRPGYVL